MAGYEMKPDRETTLQTTLEPISLHNYDNQETNICDPVCEKGTSGEFCEN